MSDPSLQPQILNLGTVVSKGDIDSTFFNGENEESTEQFQVDANLISTGRTCVIGTSGCIPGDEFFYSKNGVVKVSEVYNGMPSHSGYISDITYRRDEIYKVVLHGDGRGTIEFIASSEHPILISLPCNRKFNHSGHKYHEHERWITVKELFEKKYRFAYAKLADSDRIKANEVSIGKTQAKLLGYLMSDGTWGKKQSPKFTNNNVSFVEDVIMLSQGLISEPKIYSKRNGMDLLLVDNRHSKHNNIMELVRELGVSDRNTFGRLQCLQKDELIEFFKGYFNGDGHIFFGNNLREMIFYVGIHRRQAVELQFMLWRLGIYSTIKHRVGQKQTIRGCWEVKVCQPSAKLAARLFKDIKHPEIFDKLISYPEVALLNNLGVPRLSDKNWIKIRSIELIGEETVVGWQSNPDHEIISYGGLVTHNSGKSYAVGVICEELCKTKVPFAIIDLEGEYSGLKEKYEAIWVGDDEGCDLAWSKNVDLKQLARYSPDCPPIILDVSEVHRPREKVNEFLIALYSEISKRRTPYLVILEEADRFSPQSGGERLPIIDEIARRGRKRGLGLIVCTQRPSLVDKNILSQCSNQLIGKLVIKNDLNSVAQFFSGRDAPNVLTSIKPGEFFALGGLSPEPAKVKMRTRETRHGGMTPKLNPAAVRPSVEKVLESIQTATPLAVVETREDVIALPKPEIVRQLPPVPNINSLNYKVDDEIARPEETEETVAALPMDDFLDWDTRRTTGLMGFTPLIERETVPRLLKLGKSYKLFGQKENVTRVGIAYRPLIEVGVRIRSGVLKKKFETKYFFMDGVNGKLVEISDRLEFLSGIEKLLGLDEGQVIILKALYPNKDLSLIEIAGASKRLEDETRTLLRGLESRRLVRSTKLGRAKMYRRLADVPKVYLLSKPLLKLNELDPSEGFKLAKIKIKEDQVREVVKGMWKGADVESFKQIYYPVYLAELILNRKKRYVWIDGRTGKEIEF